MQPVHLIQLLHMHLYLLVIQLHLNLYHILNLQQLMHLLIVLLVIFIHVLLNLSIMLTIC